MQRDFLEVAGNRVSDHYLLCKKHLYQYYIYIFSIRNTYFHEHLGVFFIPFFLTAVCQARIYSLFFYLFLQKIRRPVLFSTSWLFLIVIDKFNSRNSCGYCLRYFKNFPRGTPAVKFRIKNFPRFSEDRRAF